MTGRPLWSSHRGDPLTDRGLFYGDGLFETILIASGVPRLLDLHLQRLERSAEVLGIALPEGGLTGLRDGVLHGLRESGVQEAALKLIVSREASGRGYAANAGAGSHCHVLIYGRDAPDASLEARAAINVGLCATRLARQPALAGHKHLNRLEQVIARSEWQRKDIAEALMLDTEDELIEGTASNLFLVQGGVLRTPSLAYSGVAGVMREWVLQNAKVLNIEVQISTLSLNDVMNADEMFLTNALIGVRSVSNYVGALTELSVVRNADSHDSADQLHVSRHFAESSVAQRLGNRLAALTGPTGQSNESS